MRLRRFLSCIVYIWKYKWPFTTWIPLQSRFIYLKRKHLIWSLVVMRRILPQLRNPLPIADICNQSMQGVIGVTLGFLWVCSALVVFPRWIFLGFTNMSPHNVKTLQSHSNSASRWRPASSPYKWLEVVKTFALLGPCLIKSANGVQFRRIIVNETLRQ